MLTRFYFHLVKGENRIVDRVGTELCREVAMSPAIVESVREIWPGTADRNAWEGWSVEIVDATGRVIRTVTLR